LPDSRNDHRGTVLDIVYREAQDLDPFAQKPGIAAGIAIFVLVMSRSIDLDAKVRACAVEIENVRSDRVLSPKVEADRIVMQQKPKCSLGPRHRAAQLLSAVSNEIGRAHLAWVRSAWMLASLA
jgi:hypothetical protein